MPTAVNPGHPQRWFLTRRLIWISLTVVLGQSLISLAITTALTNRLMEGLLQGTMQRQGLKALNRVNNQLDQLTAAQAKACCTLKDYQHFLKPLELNDGKVALIVGQAGLASRISGQDRFSTTQLRQFATEAIDEEGGFAIIHTSAQNAVAVKAMKLAGGAQTGHFVYLRPVYAMPAVKTQSMIKFGAELVLILVTGVVLVMSAKRVFQPVRRISTDLASIELNTLDGATLSTAKAPIELLPILEEFNRMVERLRQAALNQKQFASTISHEFRTPLTVISGFLQSVLNRSDTLTEQQRKALGIADQEVLRLNRMLSDLLDLSRADNHQLSVRRDAFSLLPSLEHALRLARAAHRNPIHDDLAAVPNLADLEVVGDPDRLVQCIGNLIGNAAKYSPPDQPVALEVNHQGTAVEISVIDQGPGIPADQLERIFERFTRAEGVALPKGESSSGLGLSIVTMLMQAMGGSVSVSSTMGQGSRFSLRLPVADQP